MEYNSSDNIREMSASATIIPSGIQAQYEYGHRYGSQSLSLTHEQFAALKNGQQLAIDIMDGEYVLFLKLDDADRMSKYEFSLHQEVLLEKGADILGSLFRYKQANGITDDTDPVMVMYSLIWRAKQDTLLAKTKADLQRIENEFDLAGQFAEILGA